MSLPNKFNPLAIQIPMESKATSLIECLEEFFSGQTRPSIKCDGCGERGNVTETIRLQELAPYMVVEITRATMGGKLNTNVPIPMGVVSLEPYLANSSRQDGGYEVFGVVEHFGRQ